ncbi:hypothetical protein JL720_12874 [Aureococcus anophagefferens]|nr:hypothetical protein JL720_12874 [Aureococcus anophagefferens]
MNRSLLRLCLWAASAAVAGGRPLSWLFNSKQSEFAATCRRLEREAQEFESGERVLLEQLRQMRVTTGNLRAELRESVKKSDGGREAAASSAQLEAEVAALKDKLAAAEAAFEAAPAADADVVAVAAQDPARRPAGSLGPVSAPHRRKRAAAMIKGIIIVNNNGQARICKFFQSVHEEGYSAEDAQQQVVRKVFQQVAQRPDSFCNYLEEHPGVGRDDEAHLPPLRGSAVFAVDELESDLGILDLIQVFVEALDKCFENVCELDLIFHSDKVHYILDEIVMAGMVLETNIVSILQGVNDQNKLHQKSLSKLNEALGVTGKAQAR